MAGEKLHFPSRAERKALIAQIKKLNNPNADQDQFFRDYLQALEKVDAKMEELSAENEKGIPKDLTEEDAKTLCGLMLIAEDHAENYLVRAMNANDGKLPEGAPTVVDKLQALMAKEACKTEEQRKQLDSFLANYRKRHSAPRAGDPRRPGGMTPELHPAALREICLADPGVRCREGS